MLRAIDYLTVKQELDDVAIDKFKTYGNKIGCFVTEATNLVWEADFVEDAEAWIFGKDSCWFYPGTGWMCTCKPALHNTLELADAGPVCRHSLAAKMCQQLIDAGLMEVKA